MGETEETPAGAACDGPCCGGSVSYPGDWDYVAPEPEQTED